MILCDRIRITFYIEMMNQHMLKVFAGNALRKRKLIYPAKLPELMNAYDEHGFVYCFSMSVLDHGVTEPEHYSEKDANALANTLRKSGDGSAADRPDIVVV